MISLTLIFTIFSSFISLEIGMAEVKQSSNCLNNVRLPFTETAVEALLLFTFTFEPKHFCF